MKQYLKAYQFAVLVASIFLLALVLAGCKETASVDSTGSTQLVVDSVGREVAIPVQVQKAVVANRYNMEIIKSLGALDKVVGVDYGIYQDQAAYGEKIQLEQVIGASQSELNYEKIVELAPDILVVTGNGAWEDAERKLAPFGIKVIVMDAYYTDQFEATYTLAGQVFGKTEEAKAFIAFFKKPLAYIQQQLAGVPKKKVYFEYKRSGNTTVPGDYFYQMVEYAHGDNIFKEARNTMIDIEAVVTRNPEFIVKVGAAGVAPKYTPPTAADFAQRMADLAGRPGWEQVEAVKKGNILLLSQYAHGGAAKLIGTMYIAKFMYPEYLPDLHPEQIFETWVTAYQKLDYLPGHTYPAFKRTE